MTSPTRNDSATALAAIRAADEEKNATKNGLTLETYIAAGVTGAQSAFLSAYNSALNSDAVTCLLADTPQKLQQIVDSYSAILQIADGVAGNTATPLTAAQWAIVGVNVKEVADTFSLAHNLHFLNSVVGASTNAQVDTVPELQAIADAAHHVMSWVGSLDVGGLPPASPTVPLTGQDLQTLGITGSYAGQMAAINTALQHTGGILRTALDTQSELQSFVDYTVANGHGPAIPYPMDDQKNQVMTAVDPVVMPGINHAVSTAVDPGVVTIIDPVPVDPFSPVPASICALLSVSSTLSPHRMLPLWKWVLQPRQRHRSGVASSPPSR